MADAITQHELVCLLKELALELGRTPTRDEFQSSAGHTSAIRRFGYGAIVHASGLESAKLSRKIDNSIFDKSIDKHLADYKPRSLEKLEPYKRTLFIPDLHSPFIHQPTVEKIYRFAEKEQPEHVIQVGDLYDQISHSKFPRSLNIFTPREESRLARECAETMWKEIRKACPKARLTQMVGNHDSRPLKRILEVYPEAEDWVEEIIKRQMSFDGVDTIFDHREELMLPGDVMVIHGYRSKLGDHRNYALHNVVCGHQHVGGVVYRQIRGRVLWELNAGLAGDPESKGLSYTPQKTVNWTLGWGWLDEYGPRFIPA